MELGRKFIAARKVLIVSIVLSLMVLGAANISSANAATSTRSSLKIGFYATSCPTAESLIQKATQTKWNVDKTITAGILRMFFHDCFVQVQNLVIAPAVLLSLDHPEGKKSP